MKVFKSLFQVLMALLLAFGTLGALPITSVNAVSPDLRISQVYGGGGNIGAPYTHDYIEIFNAGAVAVSLANLSLQYTSPTGAGNFGTSTTLITELPSVTLGAGQYFLVQEASGSIGVPLPTPDLIDTTPIAMSATSGKVVLVNSAAPLGCNGGSTPCSSAQLALIIDLVGFGNANFFEGTTAAPALTNTTAAFRASGGCTDTDNNGADFTVLTPAPRNTTFASNSCTTDIGLTAMVDAYTAVKDTELVVTAASGVLSNDLAAFPFPLIALLDVTAGNGELFLVADGSFTYDPNEGFVGVDSFTYKAFDFFEESGVTTVTITVTEKEPPFVNLYLPVIVR